MYSQRRRGVPAEFFGNRACAQRRSRFVIRGLTTPNQPLGRLAPMNHITRQPPSSGPITTPTDRTPPTVDPPPRPGSDRPPTTDRERIRLPWRRLDRLESATTLGMVLAAPRSALRTLDKLGARIPPSTAVALQRPRAVTSSRRIR